MLIPDRLKAGLQPDPAWFVPTLTCPSYGLTSDLSIFPFDPNGVELRMLALKHPGGLAGIADDWGQSVPTPGNQSSSYKHGRDACPFWHEPLGCRHPGLESMTMSRLNRPP
jgi:hypothetical protein